MIRIGEEVGGAAGRRVLDDHAVGIDRECPVGVVLEETAVGEERDER